VSDRDALSRAAAARRARVGVTIDGGTGQVVTPAAPAAPEFTGRGKNALIAQGASFGFSDEITAGLVALLSQLGHAGRETGIGQVYRDTLEAERGEVERAREAAGPLKAFAYEAGGSLLTGGALAKAAQRFQQFRTLSAARQATAVTAAEGGLAGVGASEGDLSDRLVGGAVGAGTALVAKAGIDAFGRSVGARLAGDVADVPTAAGKTIVKRADELGIKLTGGMETGSRAALLGESATRRNALTVGFFEKTIRQNKRQIVRKVLSRFGEVGDRLDGDILEKIEIKIGDDFGRLGRQMARTFRPTQNAVNLLQQAQQYADDISSDGLRAFNARLEGAAKLFNKSAVGKVDPQVFMARLTETRNSAIRAARAGRAVDAEALSLIEDSLLEAASANNPQMAARLEVVRAKWRDFKLISEASVTDATTGTINPVMLANRLARNKYTARVFGTTDETHNPIMEIGRLVRQLADATDDPGQFVGKGRSSFTPEGQSYSPASIATFPIRALAAAGQTMRPEAVTRATQAAGMAVPRAAALAAGRPRENDERRRRRRVEQ